jgi:lipopolysaccharide export system protein LptA
MACKFHAAMSQRLPLSLLAIALLACLASPAARAEKADRAKRVTIEADQPGTVDLLKQVVVFNGNVVVAQGTLLIRADRVEVRESTDGFRAATAIGGASRLARFRQKRDGVDEYIEGSAERIEFDGKADSVVFTGNAQVRRLRGTTVADEVNGSRIQYDNLSEVFKVQGGGTASPANPGGRVRAVLTPREAAASAPPPSPAASATGSALKPSGALGERR